MDCFSTKKSSQQSNKVSGIILLFISLTQRHRAHPLVLDDEEEPALQVETQMSPNRAKPNTEPPTKEEVNHCPPVPGTMEEVEIEMEVSGYQELSFIVML